MLARKPPNEPRVPFARQRIAGPALTSLPGLRPCGMRQRNPPPSARGDVLAASLAEVRSVYDELEKNPLERDCQRRTECCRFGVTGEVPSLTHAEALLLSRAWKASGRKGAPEAIEGDCPMFDRAKRGCRVYDARPFGCRTHFCAAAGGPYARRDVLPLIRRLEAASEKLGVRDPRPLGAALRRVAEGHL